MSIQEFIPENADLTDQRITPETPESQASAQIRETMDRLYDFLDSKPGVAVSAATLYRGVTGETYDPADKDAARQRMYLQLMFNPKHSFGKRFYARCMEEGKSVQVGTMFIDRDDYDRSKNAATVPRDIVNAHGEVPRRSVVEDNKKRKRLYRMFDSTDYSPSRDDGLEIRDGFIIDWEPAVENVEVLEKADSETAVQKQARKANRKRAKAKAKAAKKSQPKAEKSDQPDWVPDFTQAVLDAIIQKDEEGLMEEGEVPIPMLIRLSASRIMGTETQRERLHTAGLINREQLDAEASLTPEQMILASVYNANRNLLGQRTKAQKLAVGIVKQQVELHFNSKDQAS